jgi:hypothetical protein
MVKKIILLILLNAVVVSPVFADSNGLNLSGNYECNGYDSHDGGFSHSMLNLSLDPKRSELSMGLAAYHYGVFTADGTQYMGEAVANGNTLAMYFANMEPSGESDHGVSIGTVTHDVDAQGHEQTVLHKFYYEPDYKGGGNGSETCVKQN